MNRIHHSRWFQAVILVFPVCVLVGCSSPENMNNGPSRIVLAPPLLEDFPAKGWRMFPTPTDGSPAGTIFAVGHDGMRKPVDALEGLPVRTSAVEFPELSAGRFRSISLGLLLRHMLNGLPLSVSSTNDFDKTVNLKIVLRDAVEESVLARKAEPRLENMPYLFKPGQLIRTGDELYLIIETVKARKLDWQFDRAQLTKLNLDATLGQLAALAPGGKWTNGISATLTQEFPEYRRVFYLPVSLGKVSALKRSRSLSPPHPPSELFIPPYKSPGD